jgi:cysteine desulfurase family protein
MGMEQNSLIYLDNAATTFPKPRAVSEEVIRCIERYGGNAGRGTHSLAMEAAEKVFECRSVVADLFDAEGPENVFFTMNTTYALNFVIKGLLRKGDHVIISDIEHNAVWRPIKKLADAGIIEYDVFRSLTGEENRSPVRICADIARLLRPNTRLVITTHVSNLCSVKMPIAEIGRFCRKNRIYFVVDGAQSAGHEHISVRKMCIDALCVPGHKGLYGIQGSGAVVFGGKLCLDTLVEGGNGVNSLESTMPDLPPERYESGTLPLPALAGLCEGVKWLKGIGVDKVSAHEKGLFLYAKKLLCGIDGIKLYGEEYMGATLLLNLEGQNSEAVARRLGEYGICTRGGYHCSALGHKTLGTMDNGAVRVSFGAFNKAAHVDALAEAMTMIARG